MPTTNRCRTSSNALIVDGNGSDAPDIVLFSYEERWDDTGGPSASAASMTGRLGGPVAYTIQHQLTRSCGLYRRSAFLDAGGYDLDPDVLYNEDVAFHCRMARAGLRFARTRP